MHKCGPDSRWSVDRRPLIHRSPVVGPSVDGRWSVGYRPLVRRLPAAGPPVSGCWPTGRWSVGCRPLVRRLTAAVPSSTDRWSTAVGPSVAGRWSVLVPLTAAVTGRADTWFGYWEGAVCSRTGHSTSSPTGTADGRRSCTCIRRCPRNTSLRRRRRGRRHTACRTGRT